MAPRWILALLSAPLLVEPAPGIAAASERPAALTIEAGSVASRQIVALGRDVQVAGQADSEVVAINGNARITGRVAGDLIVLGGDAFLGSDARVRGDVLVLGGRLETAPGARIEGRSVVYPTISATWLTLLEGPSLGMKASSPVVIGAKLALLAAWVTLTLMLLASDGNQILSASEQLRSSPLRDFVVGLTGVLAMLLTALFFSAFAAVVVGVPLLALVVMLALMLKLWGMVAVFHAFGDWLGWRVLKRRLLPLHGALVGLLVLGVVKLMPWIGTWAWTAASLIAIGASLTTKFGRREPWFDLGPDLTHRSAA